MGQAGVSLRATRDKLLVFLGEEADFSAVVQGLRSELRQSTERAGCSEVMLDTGKRVISERQLRELKRVIERETGLKLARVVDSIDMASKPSWWPSPMIVPECQDTSETHAENDPIMNCQYIVVEAEPIQDDTPTPMSLDKKQYEEVTWHRALGGALEVAVATDKPIAGVTAGIIPAPNAYMHRSTLRSGQSVVFNGDVVVLGDVNPGAEVVATGDVAIMGTLRGLAHAGSGGNRDATVTAFRLCPTQIRIADMVARPPDDEKHKAGKPEIARIQDGVLVIESLERHLPSRRRGGNAE